MSKSSFLATLNRAATKPTASLSSWLGKSIRLTDGEFFSQFFANSASGKAVSVNTAMRLSAVWACVRLLSETIATLPVGLYQKRPDGSRVKSDIDLHTILSTQPNIAMTAVSFWEAVVASMLLAGNAYIEIHRSAGAVIALDFLLPSRIDVKCINGKLRYWYTPYNGQRREITRNNMMHIPAFSLDGMLGLSTISYGANVFGNAMSAEDVAGNTFQNGMTKTVAFKVDRILKKEQREEFREYIKTVTGAMNAGKSPVLEQGVTPETIGINPVDAQLLESRAYSIEEICRWFRVWPGLIGHSSSGQTMWGTGVEQMMIGFLTFSLSPWLTRIEQAINKNLLTPAQRVNNYSEFNLEGLLRADSAARADFYSKMTQNGIYTRDDCRVKENMARRGGNADVLTVQTNLAPIDQLGQKTESATARAALLNWLNTENQE